MTNRRYSSPSIIRMKSRMMGWAGHVAHMGEKRNAYNGQVTRKETNMKT
jgi:hypothetical protein